MSNLTLIQDRGENGLIYSVAANNENQLQEISVSSEKSEIQSGQIVTATIEGYRKNLYGFSAYIKDGSGPKIPAFLRAKPKQFSAGDQVQVQVVVPPRGEKSLTLTDKIKVTLPDTVITLEDNRIHASQRLDKNLNSYLKEKLKKKDLPFGLILRSNLNRFKTDKERALKHLEAVISWFNDALQKKTIPSDPLSTLLFEIAPDQLDEIILANDKRKSEIKALTDSLMGDQNINVRVMERPFEHFDLWRQIKSLQFPTVRLGGGASIIIEETAAVTAVDINLNGQTSIESAIKPVLESVIDQLRLRNISGQIVIDAPHIGDNNLRKRLVAHLKRLCRDDRAKITIHGFSAMGLIEITRQRIGLSLSEQLGE